MTGITPSDDAQWRTKKWVEIQAIGANTDPDKPVEARLWVSDLTAHTSESAFIDTLNLEMRYVDRNGELNKVDMYLHKDDAERLGVLLQYAATHGESS